MLPRSLIFDVPPTCSEYGLGAEFWLLREDAEICVCMKLPLTPPPLPGPDDSDNSLFTTPPPLPMALLEDFEASPLLPLLFRTLPAPTELDTAGFLFDSLDPGLLLTPLPFMFMPLTPTEEGEDDNEDCLMWFPSACCCW